MKTRANQITVVLLSGWIATSALAAEDLRSSPPITPGADVTIALTIQLPEEQTVLTERLSRYIHGHHEVLPALEEALDGKREGDQAHLDLDAEHAFGPYDTKKKMSVAREQIPKDAQVGDVAKTSDGQIFTVLQLSDREALIDFNHPLAGKRVVLNVTVLRVRPQS